MSCIAIRSDAIQPTKGSDLSAGYDLATPDAYTVQPKQQCMVSTGLRVLCPEGTYARIAPRSGLAAKHSIDVMAGVVDPDYRGEVKVILMNFGETPLHITPGMRIAQLIFEKYDPVSEKRGLDMVFESSDSDCTQTTGRGDGGFGSTGL